MARAVLILLLALSAAGCAGAAEQRAAQERWRAALHEQRARQLESDNASLRAAAALQQWLLVQSIVARAATPPPAAAPPAEVVCAPAPGAPPVDLAGGPIPIVDDAETSREIVSRIEAVLGRPLRPQERLSLMHLLRRPRSIDLVDPWIVR